MRESTAIDAEGLRHWLMSPRPDTGIHLASDDGGWEFVSYPTLADQARRIAALLVDQGVGSGDSVAVLMPTSNLCLATMFAVQAAGATLTPIAPPQFQDPDQYIAHLHAILAVAEAGAVVTCAAYTETVTRAVVGLAQAPTLIAIDQVPTGAPLGELIRPGRDVLLQMTSGSTSKPRGALISWRNLAANLDVIDAVCDMKPDDVGASWLPLYHDMGLIGAVLQAVTRQRGLRLLRPDQFIRDPARWLQAAAVAQHTASPPFGLAYASRRLTPADLGDIDLSGLRTLVIGAEPINPAQLRDFAELTAAHGFSPAAFLPTYGLAEHTLIATGHRLGQPHRMTRVDRTALRHGQPVRVLDQADDISSVEPGADWVVSVGAPAADHGVRIVDESGARTADGALGEIVLSGASVSAGYRGNLDSATRFVDDELYTGDAGFLQDGELHVLGRMGTSLKVNGRSVFAEDLDLATAAAMGLSASRLVTAAVNDGGAPGLAVFLEAAPAVPPSGIIAAGRIALQAHIGEEAPLWFIGVPRGGLSRTSSGKPRRAHMWQQWCAGHLTGAELLAAGGSAHEPNQLEQVRALFEKSAGLAVIPDDAGVHFEGSLAEGFGNAGSDIDILLLVPGTAREAVMPTVLFVDGRRVEIRAQSHEQVRKRLERIRHAIDTGSLRGVTEDLLNRVQRFLHGIALRIGPHYGDLLDIVSYAELTQLMAHWWRRRAEQCLRQSAALALLDHDSAGDADRGGEAVSWGREGVVQAMKAFLAERGEGYLEVKWLPQQIARLRPRVDGQTAAILDDYRNLDHAQSSAIGCREFVQRALALSARMGAPAITLDPANVILRRVPAVTTWPIGSTTHVVRGKVDIFVLSAHCAESWRRVVFGQTLASTQAKPEHLGLFARYGLIAFAWRGAGVIKPVAAMCDPSRPLTPLPSNHRPVVTINGAPSDGDIARSPLGAKAFAECASALILANMVLENAREDFNGAVKDAQWHVTSLCGRRIVLMAVRILASAWGITPLPGDPVLLHNLDSLVPEHRQLASNARRLCELSIHDHDEALSMQAELDRLVSEVRAATGGDTFPASFSSREQWQQTIRYGYQWLRLGGHLKAYVELDETRDLLSSGGAQPSARASRPDPASDPRGEPS